MEWPNTSKNATHCPVIYILLSNSNFLNQFKFGPKMEVTGQAKSSINGHFKNWPFMKWQTDTRLTILDQYLKHFNQIWKNKKNMRGTLTQIRPKEFLSSRYFQQKSLKEAQDIFSNKNFFLRKISLKLVKDFSSFDENDYLCLWTL